MSKIATIQIVDGVVSIRTKWNGGRYNPKTQFMQYEISNKLDRELKDVPWIDITSPQAEVLENIINEGWSHPDIMGGSPWKNLFGYLKDLKGKAILIPKNSEIKGLKDIGCITHMTELSQATKAGKYINRHFAPLQMGEDYILGSFDEEEASIEEMGGEGVVKLDHNGEFLIVKYVDLDTLTPEQVSNCDGHIHLSPRGAELLGLKKPASVTISTPYGMGKGHSKVIPGLEPDLVIYGPKKVYTTPKFEFGIRADLHPGRPHTDQQSAINFGFDRPSMMPALAKEWLQYIFAAAHNEMALKKTLLGNVKSGLEFFSTKEEMDRIQQLQEESWSLLKWMRAGVSPFCGQPWLYRKVVRHLTTSVIQVMDARVPMEYAPNKGVAISRYVAGDVYAVQSDGDIDMSKSIIPEGFCVCMDLPAGTKVVIYRQPNENQNAHVILENMHHPAYEFAKGGPYIYLGHGQDKIAARLGGMDNDDALIIVHDPIWVAGFEELAEYPYPEFGPLVSEEELAHQAQMKDVMSEDGEDQALSVYDLLYQNGMKGWDPEQYGDHHAIYQIEQSKTARAGIGPVANMIMVDTAMSTPRYKQFIAKWLEKRGKMELLDVLANRQDYQASKFATHLELIIDGNVKDPALLKGLGDVPKQLREFHDRAVLYPRSLARRIPAKKKSKKDFVLVETPLCRAINRMQESVDNLLEAFKVNEWLLVRPAEIEVLMSYPAQDDIVRLVHGEPRTTENQDLESLDKGILGIWANGWGDAFASGIQDPEYLDNMRTKLVDEIHAKVRPYLPEIKEIAVELYRSYYKARKSQAARDESGRRRGYTDGLLGLDLFNHALLDVFKELRMTGTIFMVDFDRYESYLGQVAMNVRVSQGVVFRQKDMRLLGLSLQCPDGDYPMVAGMIEAKKAHPCLRAAEDLYDLPMDIEVANMLMLPGEND